MRHYLPALVLLLLSPLFGEIFLGATTVSRLTTALPLVFFYGGGAVIIRELARRHGPGWWRIIVLAMAYGIVEEGLATQTLANPDLFRAGQIGGRWLGVNWVWGEWTVGYHAIYSIAIPILLAELLFPTRKDGPWLGRKGLMLVCVGYVLSALVIGIAFRRIIAPGFYTPLPLVVAECLAITILGGTAVFLPNSGREMTPSTEAHPWVISAGLVGLTALLVAVAWMLLLLLPGGLKTGAGVAIPLLGGPALCVGLAGLIRRWSSNSEDWTARHRLALVMGALPPVMLFGFLVVTSKNRVDQAGQATCSVAMMVWLSWLIWRSWVGGKATQVQAKSGDIAKVAD